MVVMLAVATTAHAYPTLAPRPVASAIAGPADPHVAAAFYNPAALGPLKGVHFWMDSGPRVHLGEIDRGGEGKTSVNYTDFDAFLGVTWDLGTDTLTVAISTMVPFTDLASFGDSPVRYHSINQTFVTYQQSFSVGFRLSSRFYIGAGFNVSENWMQLRFARDAALAGGSAGVDQAGGLCGAAPCGVENAAARQLVRMRGFAMGYGFSIGILGRASDRLWLAASYISHYFSGDAEDEIHPSDEQGTRVSGPDVACTGGCQGNARMTFYLPDIAQAAARVDVSSQLDLEATLRWVHWGKRSQIELQHQGGNLGQIRSDLALPLQSRRDLGLQDTFGVEVSARVRVGRTLRLMPSLFFETSSVQSTAVSAAALDAPKLDVALVAEWRPVKHLSLGAHAGLTSFLIRDVTSRHDPRDTIRCVDAQYDVNACRDVISGDGLPSASGRYTLFVLHVGAAIGLDY
jgi:long-subunit fatty acid transport protein